MVMQMFPMTIEKAIIRKRGKVILGPLSLMLSEEKFTAVLGPNGAGKTTLLRLIHGLEYPKSGSIKWAINEDEARQRQSFVFQHPIMLHRSLIDNIAYPLLIRGVNKQDAYEQADQYTQKINLVDQSTMSAKLLSGGEQQKVAIARALITKPDLLLLDEPTANLDGKATREIETILLEAVKNGTKVIMTTHHLGQAKRLASDVLFLYRGKLHEQQTASAFFEKPKTAEAKAFISGEIVE